MNRFNDRLVTEVELFAQTGGALVAANNLADLQSVAAAKVNLGIEDVVAATESVAGRVELLTNAELAAGADTTRAATAASIASLFANSDRSVNGYAKLPVKVGGAFVEIIIQWGISATISPAGNVSVTLPIVFPNAILRVFATTDSTGNNTNNYSVSTYSFTTSGFKITNNSASSGVVTAPWLAIGY